MNEAATPDGTPMVVLTQEEYASLRAEADDLADVIAYDAAIAEGATLAIPDADVGAILDGTLHPLRAWRKAAGLTQAALAARAGIRTATVAEIERRTTDPRLSTLTALAAALGLEIGDIVPDP